MNAAIKISLLAFSHVIIGTWLYRLRMHYRFPLLLNDAVAFGGPLIASSFIFVALVHPCKFKHKFRLAWYYASLSLAAILFGSFFQFISMVVSANLYGT
jgi:hypothetical protein